MMGINPIDLLTGNTTSTGPTQISTSDLPPSGAGEDELSQFVGVVVKETENLWGEVFQQNNLRYAPPKVVLFTQQINAAAAASRTPAAAPSTVRTTRRSTST